MQSYSIAVGPQQGYKAFCLQSLPSTDSLEETSARVAKAAGFSLHAGVAAACHERRKLERLCATTYCEVQCRERQEAESGHHTPGDYRDVPVVTSHGNIRYQLKTLYRDGTTHVIFEALDFMARLAALAPKTLALLAGWALPRPRVNLARYHGVFAPNSPYLTLVSKAGRGRSARHKASEEVKEDTPAARRAAMSWAQHLKRVFRIDVETCQACGVAVKIIASIEDPVVIGKILAHMGETGRVGCGRLDRGRG